MKASEYAAVIGEEIRAVEIAVQGPSDDWHETTPEDDNEHDARYRASLAVFDCATWINPDDIFSGYVNDHILEVIYWRGSNGTTRTEWLRTFGGPTCRIYFESDDYATIESTGDDNETARVWVYAPTLAMLVNEIAEGVTV